MITAQILADSVNPSGSRLTTAIWKYPLFLHGEVMTHRTGSRNAASSRAIPFKKMVEMVREEMAMPEYWGAEQKGMQAGISLGEVAVNTCKAIWIAIGGIACTGAELLHNLGLHKSICNRVIGPWSHITTLMTMSDAGWSNFFALRAHKDAEPSMQVLAYRMLYAYIKSIPAIVPWGDWHIPEFEHARYIPLNGGKNYSERQVKIATARCARLSYLTFDGEHSPEKDIALHDQLLGPPFHASPFEHCCLATQEEYTLSNFDTNGIRCGFKQYRKFFDHENNTSLDLSEILKNKPQWIEIPESTR